MNTTIAPGLLAADQMPVELVERKGAGHPDTLADGVAEAISRDYSRFCLDTFGAILHHNTDKTALLGGLAEVSFGSGKLVQPITVLVNGRLTRSLGDQAVPVHDIVRESVREFLGGRLPLLDLNRDVVIKQRLTQASSPGAVHGTSADQVAGRTHWFAPRSLDDLAERHRMFANDTSAGVGYAPLGVAEQLAIEVESHLSSSGFLHDHPYVGTDIKLMVARTDRQIHLTACVPQIAAFTPDLATYLRRREELRELIGKSAAAAAPGHDVQVAINTRDDAERCELYLTATGTSLESGDEGVVGRGNRANGLISMLRPWSAEGVSGKNPVYHVGKLYNLAAAEAAARLHALSGVSVAIALVSQSGRDLDDPWQVIVHHSGSAPLDPGLVCGVVADVLAELDTLRRRLLDNSLATA